MTSATRFCAQAAPVVSGVRRSALRTAIRAVILQDIPASPLPGSQSCVGRARPSAVQPITLGLSQFRKQLSCFHSSACDLAHTLDNISANNLSQPQADPAA